MAGLLWLRMRICKYSPLCPELPESGWIRSPTDTDGRNVGNPNSCGILGQTGTKWFPGLIQEGMGFYPLG